MTAKLRVAILISGGGSNMSALLADMADPAHPCEPALVLSNRADAGGLAKAAARGVATAVVDHRPHKGDRPAFEAELNAALSAARPAGHAGRMLNIHPSLLPLFPGLHTHARAIEAGCAVHGCTVHEVTAELDLGPILGQAVVPVLPGDDPDALAARVLRQEHRLYPQALRRFAVGEREPFAILDQPA